MSSSVLDVVHCIAALAAAITCASLALSDGGVEMFDLAVGMSLVFSFSFYYEYRTTVHTQKKIN